MTIENAVAICVLTTIARTRLQLASEVPSAPEIRTLLTAAFGEPVPSSATEGELAEAALTVLAENSEFAGPIRVMASQTASNVWQRCYMEPATIAVTTAALLALQTRIGFKIDHTGKWSLVLDKKAASDSVLKLLVQRLISLLPK